MTELLPSPTEAENGSSFGNPPTSLVALITGMGVNELKALSELQAKVRHTSDISLRSSKFILYSGLER